MLSQTKRVVTVATDAELLNKHYYARLWLAVQNINIPRRQWLDVIATAFLDDIDIVWPSGKPYDLPMVDDVFANDFQMRWFSYYQMADNTGHGPRSHSYKLERLRLIDLYFRITHPHIAAHFGR
jgi:hypothetical protein